MNIRDIAESDLAETLEDVENGFGVALKLYDEDKTEYSVNCQCSDIGYFIDPQTGCGVIGRRVEINIRISSLALLCLDPPSTKWTAKYTDKQGNEWSMAIAQPPMVDRALGIYGLILEAYDESSN